MCGNVSVSAHWIVASSFPSPRYSAKLVVAALSLTLAGCATYESAPVDLPAVLSTRRAESLDPARVMAVVKNIAPEASQDNQADRLFLFAAALIYNPDVEASRAAVASALAGVQAARVASAANLTLTAEYAQDASATSPWLLGTVLDLPLGRGIRRNARTVVANLAVEAARYDQAEVIWTARMAIRKALTDRLIAARRADAFKRVVDLRVRQQTVLERRVAAGEASRAELDRVRADGADAVRGQADARVHGRDAELRLAAAVGLPADALMGLTSEWPEFDTPVNNPGVGVDPAQLTQALLSRADVLKAIVAYDQAEADLRLEVAKQYPALTVSPGYTWERGLVKLPVSLGLALPPWDLNRSAIALAQALRTEAGLKLEAILASADPALQAALAETRASRLALNQVRTVEIPTAQALADQADRELRAGAIDRADWAAAQAGAAQTRLIELDALARVHAADAALEDAVRRPLEGPETQIIFASDRSRP